VDIRFTAAIVSSPTYYLAATKRLMVPIRHALVMILSLELVWHELKKYKSSHVSDCLVNRVAPRDSWSH
jgi:hypothetical protein